VIKKKAFNQKVDLIEKTKVDNQKRSEWIKKQRTEEKEEWKNLKDKLKAKGKRVKDPKAPKRAKSAFLWYYTKNFSEISQNQGGGAAPEILKSAAETFKDLSAEAKAPYLLLQQEDKNRYTTERKRYVSHNKSPKRILTPYIRFFTEINSKLRKENPTLKITEISKLIGKKWKEMSVDEKKKFQDAYEKEKLSKTQNSSMEGSDSE